jgi:hypothetical protein
MSVLVQPDYQPRSGALDKRQEIHLRRPLSLEVGLFTQESGGGFLVVDRVG